MKNRLPFFFLPESLRLDSRKAFVLLLFLFCACLVYSQDMVHLKDGTVKSGKIIEDKPGEYLKLRISSGGSSLEYTYAYTEIEKVEIGKPKPVRTTAPSLRNSRAEENAALSLEEFGGTTGFGISAGDGLTGFLRFCPAGNVALEAGLGAGATTVKEDFFGDELISNYFGLQFEGAAHLMGARKEKPNGKIKSNGFLIRAGHVSSDVSSTFVSGAWAMEAFNPMRKKSTRSFLFELGLKASFGGNENYEIAYPALPYLRFRWVWYFPRTQPLPPSHLEPTPDEVQPTNNTGQNGQSPTVQGEPQQGQSKQSEAGQRQAGQTTLRQPATPGLSGKTYPAPLRKSSILVATSTGLANGPGSLGIGRNAAGFSFFEEGEEKHSVVGLSPNVGYFFNDDFAAGVSLSLSSATEKDGDTKRINSIFLIGPFARYYGDLPGNSRMKWTAEAALGFGTAKTKRKVNGQVFENATGLFSLSLGPGLAYFLSDRVALEVQGVYERLSTKDKETDVESTTGSFGLRVGFGVFL